MLCNHHQNHALEHLITSPNSHMPFAANHSLHPLPLATSDLISVFSKLYYKLNHAVCILLSGFFHAAYVLSFIRDGVCVFFCVCVCVRKREREIIAVPFYRRNWHPLVGWRGALIFPGVEQSYHPSPLVPLRDLPTHSNPFQPPPLPACPGPTAYRLFLRFFLLLKNSDLIDLGLARDVPKA